MDREDLARNAKQWAIPLASLEAEWEKLQGEQAYHAARRAAAAKVEQAAADKAAEMDAWRAAITADVERVAAQVAALEASAGAFDPTRAAPKRCIDGLAHKMEGWDIGQTRLEKRMDEAAGSIMRILAQAQHQGVDIARVIERLEKIEAAQANPSTKMIEPQADPATVAAWKAEISGKTAPVADHRADGWYLGWERIRDAPEVIRFVRDADADPGRQRGGGTWHGFSAMGGLRRIRGVAKVGCTMIEAPGGPLDKAAGIA